MNLFALDIETASNEKNNPQFALEPFRLVQGRARITDISVYGPDNYNTLIKNPTKSDAIDILKFLSGKVTYMHYAVFDTAWLYALIGDISPLIKIPIRDTALLAKWLLNSQYMQFAQEDDGETDYRLISLITRFLKDHPEYQQYLEMKNNNVTAGENEAYWSARAIADTKFTYLLACELQARLPAEQRNGFIISQRSIPYVARSWVNGIPFNWDEVQRMIPLVERAKVQLANDVGLHPSTINSSSQLSHVLFKEWGMSPINVGKSGKGSVAAGDLKMLALRSQGTDIGPKMKLIMDYKKLQTLQSKYLDGLVRVHDYVGTNVCHGAPRMFGTYTGRYTYSSKTLKTNAFQTSIAMHQLPRKGPAKGLMLAPEGKCAGKYDASGQEIAFMAWASGDENLLHVLNSGMNVHSWMATNMTGDDYMDFVRRLKSGDVTLNEIRQAAKLLNLSCQYRIGWKALQQKFFDTYDQIITQMQSNQYLNLYKTSYPGVVRYWKWICEMAMQKGYTETIAKRRYYLTDWAEHRWATESSAINTPVQGSGADQKDLVVWLVSERFPEIEFALDIHDEAIFFMPLDKKDEISWEVLRYLNAIDYNHYWQMDVPMPLTFEGKIGLDLKNCDPIEMSFPEIQKLKESGYGKVVQ